MILLSKYLYLNLSFSDLAKSKTIDDQTQVVNDNHADNDSHMRVFPSYVNLLCRVSAVLEYVDVVVDGRVQNCQQMRYLGEEKTHFIQDVLKY